MGLFNSTQPQPTLLHEPPATFHYVLNRPASDCDPYAVNIGPTKSDFSVVEKTQARKQKVKTKERSLISGREKALMRRWKNQDLSDHYRSQRSNYYR